MATRRRITDRAEKAGEPWGRAPIRFTLTDNAGNPVSAHVNGQPGQIVEPWSDLADPVTGDFTADLWDNSDLSRANTFYTWTIGTSTGLICATADGSLETLRAFNPAALGSAIVGPTGPQGPPGADGADGTGGITQQEMDDAIVANSDGDRGYADTADMANLTLAETYADSLAPNYDPAGAATAAQAFAVQRGNHTGTQDFTTITGVATDAQIPATVARDAEVTAAVAAAIASVIASAPGALDTLDELAAALGDDPSFATTVTNSIATKVAKSLYDANTILAANSDDTPAALTVAEASLIGRLVGGNIAALTATQIKTLLAIASGDVSGLGSLATLSTITTTQITDGTIVNADVSASAALDGTKVNASTDTVRGAVELATNAETATGTDATRAVTPAGLASIIVPAVDVQTFTVSGTWTKPATGTMVLIECIGGGGGGGSGRKGAAASIRSGGAGGAGAGRLMVLVPMSVLGTTETVTVGAGGAGGTAISASDTNGNPGVAGAVSSFGTWLTTITQTLAAGGGTGGAVTPGTNFLSNGGTGGTPSATGLLGGDGSFAGAAAAWDLSAPTGGGAGGGITTGNAASAGGGGGSCIMLGQGTGPAGGAIGTVGTAGTDRSAQGVIGSGGGGGGSSTAAVAGTGGVGGKYGGGGGGGGAGVNAVGNSGAGGAGGAGFVRVTTF